MKLMQKVLAVMVLMLFGGGLSAASEREAPLTGPTQEERVQKVLRVLSNIDQRHTSGDVLARNVLYDEMRNGDRFNLKNILDSLKALFSEPETKFDRVYTGFTPQERRNLNVSF
jgi:hypothetical protein